MGRACKGHKFEVWMAVVCWLVKEAMSSLSSSGAVVSVPVSASSSSPPTSGGARTQWLAALSTTAARSHCCPADMFGKTARVMAARRQRREIWVSCFHLCGRAVADICCALRQDAMSAAGDCWVWPTICCPNQRTIHVALSS